MRKLDWTSWNGFAIMQPPLAKAQITTIIFSQEVRLFTLDDIYK